MTSAPVRDPLAGHLTAPDNAAVLLIDRQPAQLAAVRAMDHALLVKNAVSTVRTIKTFGSRVAYSTVNVASGQGPTLPELADLRVYRVNRLATRQTAERDTVLEEVLAIAEKWRPYRSLATSYLFSAAFEPAQAPPVARLESA